MRNLVTIFEKLFNEHDGFQRQAVDFSRAMKTQEWKFLVDAIQMIQGQMATNMFSLQHTKLTPTEKDVVQKTYYQMNQILHFLINPHGWINDKNIKKANLTGKV